MRGEERRGDEEEKDRREEETKKKEEREGFCVTLCQARMSNRGRSIIYLGNLTRKLPKT